MSLQVWLPLNRDLRQQGLSPIIMSGSVASWGDGKIGKAAKFTADLSKILYNNTSDFNYTDNFSWCGWFLTNFTSGSTQYAFTVGRADSGGYGYGLQVTSASQVSCRIGNQSYAISCPSTTWTHIAFTKQGTNIKIYVNGNITTNTTFSGTLPTYSDGNGLGLGCFHYNGGNIYGYYGSINDFRIYDHCLSAREIKEISKGLVVHYTLDHGGESTRNWAKNSYSNIAPCSTYNIANYDTTFELSGRNYLCAIKGTIGSGKKFGLWMGGGYTHCGYFTDNGNGIFTLSFRPPDTIGGDGKRNRVNIYAYPSSNTNLSSIEWFKLEGNSLILKPWIPCNYDDGYKTMGFNNSNIEYDTSGNGYNGTVLNANLGTSLVTPRNYTITDFNSNQHIYTTLSTSGFSNTYTFSWWAFTQNTSTSGRMCWGFSNGNRLNLFFNNDRFYWNTGDGDQNPFGTISSSAYLDGAWHHYVVTGDGTTTKLYIDGVFKSNATTYKAITGNTIYLNGWTNSADYNFNGFLSDFRLYSTCLLAEDVQQLYNAPISVTDNGTLFTQSMVYEI